MPINPKVKQIYDTLKDGGADVGSEKEFNDYFFAKGKDGYNNRKEVFNTLREGGADAGKSYEEFAGWLGLHAVSPKPTQTKPATPVQPARPVPAQPVKQQKPQDRPMTAAEKARMISNVGGIVRGTQAGLRRTQNMMTYAKKKAGLHVEPVKLGQKSNVVETARQYDPKTGKMQPHYLTEAGNEYDDKAQADMEQAAIDEQKRRELDPVQSQLEDAYGERDRLEEAISKRRKELEDEYNNRPWYQRMLTEMGKAAHSDIDPAATATDPEHMGFEQDEQYMQLMSAIRKNHQTIQTLEDKKNGKMNSFWHSLGTTLTNGYTFADGLPEMRDATAILNAQKHIDSINRKRQTGQALTKEEEAAEAVLRNTMTDNAVQGTYGSEYGAWGRAGSGMAQSIDFMKDFLLLPGAGSIAKGVAGKVAGAGGKYLAKEAGETAVKAAAKAIARATLKATGVVAGAHAAGAVISNTTGIGRTAAKMGQLGTGDVGIDKNGNYRMENQKDLMRAFAEAEREQARENGSEMFGEFIPGGKALSGVAKKTLSKIGLGKISDMLTGIGNKAWYKSYTNLLSKGGYNGIPGEALEEYEGMFFDAITGHADEAVQDFTDPKQQVDIWLGCATMGALMGAVPMGLHIQGYYRYKHGMDRADRAADFRLTPEKWQPLKEQIDQTDNGNMSGLVVDNILDNKNLEPQEKEAVMDYVRNLTKFRGFNIAQVNNADEAARETQAESIEPQNEEEAVEQQQNEERRRQDKDRQQAYEMGRQAADTADTDGDRSDADAIVLRLREAYDEIERVFADDVEMRLAQLEDDPWEVMNDQSLTPDQQDAVAYFVNSKAAMEGLNDAANEKGDNKHDEAARQIEQRTNKQSGMIHPATLKVDDRQVYIVSGNVAMFPDGSAVDVHHSSESVVVCDAETGELKFISPEQIYKVDEPMDPNMELQAADEAIRAEQQVVLGNDTEEVPEQAEEVANDGVASDVQNENEVNLPQSGNIPQNSIESEVNLPQNETDVQEPSALNRIPKGDNGEPLLEQTDPETAWDGVVEYMEDADDAQEYVESMVAQLTKDVDNAKKAVSKVKPSADMAKFKADKAAARQVQADAEARLDKWVQISNVNKTRRQAERNRINAERAEADRIAREKAVAELAEQKRVEAEKKAEQEAIGAHAVNPKIKEKWDAAPKVVGNADIITLPDGSKLRGHYVLTEAGAATASHDVNNAYKPTEGFPIDENGQSVNDRDYERDEDARKISRSIADNYDSRALQSVTVVDNNGITLSGNGRNIAGELAAKNGTDGAYIDYLREFPQKYGLTAEQVQSMQHPRVHFVPDEVLPYDAATFARFNAQEMKSQSKPEAAVKLGKVVPDNTFGNIVRSLAQYDRLSDFYANEKDANSAIMELVKAGVVNDKQLPELRTGEALSAAGRELLENTLIGKVFQSNPDAVRQIIAQPGIKQSIVMALSEIAHNRALAGGYDLSDELSNAVDLVARAKHADPDTYKEGMPVSPFGRQQGLFDDELGDSRVTDATTLLLADILNSTKPSDLRKVLATYNAEGETAANGQLDIFSGDLRSKEEILKDINQHFINATPKEQQALVDAAIAERKRRAAEATATEQSGRNDTAEQTASVETSSRQPQPVETTPIGTTSTPDEVQAQREQTETNPTEAQKEAGNYRKGHIKVDGFDIALENPKGSTRSGKDANGKEWSITMKHDYGYIRGTKGTDGDHIDVYLSDNPTAGNVYVVDQINQQTGAFDEHKVMYGFGSMEEAVQAYRDQYEDGWKVGKVTEVSREEFKKWVDSSTRKTKPFAEYKNIKEENKSSKDLSDKEKDVSLQSKSSENEDSRRNSQGRSNHRPEKLGENDAIGLRLASAGRESEKATGGSLSQRANREQVEAEKLAYEHDALLTLDDLFGLGKIGPSGTESDTYFSPDGYVYKMNNLMHSPLISDYLNRLSLHNEIFGNTPYDLVGFVKSGRNVYPVVRQVAVDFERLATEEEISSYMQSKGFVHDGDGKFHDNEYVVEDVKPKNVFMGKDGHVYVVDAEVSKRDKADKFTPSPKKADESLLDYAARVAEESKAYGAKTKLLDSRAMYTITPTQYTNKKGKTSDMYLVKFNHELSKEEKAAAKSFISEPLTEGRHTRRGWYDREQGGYMVRSEDAAKQLGDMMTDEDAVADAQPLTVQDYRNAASPAIRNEQEKKPANTVTVEDAAIQDVEAKVYNPEQKKGDLEFNGDVSKEDFNDALKDLRSLLGVSDDEGDVGILFRDDEELTKEQRRKIKAAGLSVTQVLVDNGMVKFPEYAGKMVSLIGDKIRPWLKSFYEGVRWEPGYERVDFTPSEEVARFDVQNFDKPSPDILKQAEMVVAEQKAAKISKQTEQEVKSERNEKRKEYEKQTEANTAAIAEEAGAVASKARTVAKSATVDTEVREATEKVDATLENVNNQLALLGYYEADAVDKDFNEAYGYMRNAEKKAVKDATELAKRLADDFGIDLYEATHTAPGKNGKRKSKPLATANIAPIGGDITIHLPIQDGKDLCIYINLKTTGAKGSFVQGDNLEVGNIMYRIENPNTTGGERYGSNNFATPDITYDRLRNDISRIIDSTVRETPTKQPTNSKVLAQYNALKSKHPDAKLLFRVGDFYETYQDDAKDVSNTLGIVLTKRNDGVNMAGFPYHALDTYLPKLIRAGYRVAICDQLEMPKETEKVVPKDMPQPKKVNVESLVRELQEKGKARLRDHAEEVKEKPATPDLHGFNIGDKVMYKGKEATLYDTDNGRPVLDAGLAPVMYEVTDWDKLTPVSSTTDTTPAKEKTSTEKEKPIKKNNSKKQSVSLKREPTVGDLFGDLFSNNNLDGKDNDTARTRQAESSSRENESVGSISADRDGVLDTRSTGGADGRETARVSDTTGTVADGERKEVSGQRSRRTTSGGNHGDGEAERPLPERGQRIGDRDDADGRSAVAGVADESQRTNRPAADTSDQLVHSEARRGERGRNVAKQQEPKFKRNYLYPDNSSEIDNMTPQQRLRSNVEALEVVRTLMKEGREATAEEREVLGRYRGWGGVDLGRAYSTDMMRRSSTGRWGTQTENDKLLSRLADIIDELDPNGERGVLSAINRAALTSYYTPTAVAKVMNGFVELAGFKGGNMLDPSMGSGVFEGTMSKGVQQRTMIHGIELDWLTGQIARHLYPDANVLVTGYEQAGTADNAYDVVMSNIPFGDLSVTDKTWKHDSSPVRKAAQNRIHNYFAVKMLDNTRPGGLCVIMTSNAILDTKSNQIIRERLADQAEVLGVVRLPDNTFKGAGTSVVTDVIFLRKFKDEADRTATRGNEAYTTNIEKPFLSSGELKLKNPTDGKTYKVAVNGYFAKNKDMMIGDGKAGGQYRADEFGLGSAMSTDEIAKAMGKLIEKKIIGDRKGKLFDTHKTEREVKQAVSEAYKGDGDYISSGNIVEQDGIIGVVTSTKNKYGDVTTTFTEMPSLKSKADRILAMFPVRKAMKQLIDMQIQGEKEHNLSEVRAELQKAYDDFVKKYGRLNDKGNDFLTEDIDGYTLRSLEKYDDGKFVGLSDIFTKNTIKPALDLTTAKTPQDAISLSLAEYGEINPSFMEEVLGDSWAEQCGETLFKTPFTEDEYETSDAYLSGDVKTKLEQARAAVKEDASLQRNVKALEAIQPKDIPFEDISIRMGARWIPAEIYTDFMYEQFGIQKHEYRNNKSGVEYMPEVDQYVVNVEKKELGGEADAWRTSRRSASEVFTAALQDKSLSVFDTIKEDGKETKVLNKEETELLNNKIQDLRTAFEDWIGQQPEREEMLMRLYNDKFNRTVLRKFDGSHLNVAGLMGKELRPHQKDAVWMLINNRGGIVDHIVGAGKTLVMQSAIMEMRRMGIAKKPMIIALKSTVAQIAKEFREAYPAARILAPTEKDFAANNRKKFMAQIALNDYDCVILSHDQYNMLPHTEEVERSVIDEQKAQLDNAIEFLYGQDDKSQLTKKQIKGLEKRKNNLETKLTNLLDRKIDREFTFEGLGVDYLFVDECQHFKSLPYVSTYDRVAGLGDKKGSQKAIALLNGVRYLQKMHQGDQGTVFLSGTTISNSLSEIYHLLNYLRPSEMERLGMTTFDAWAGNFAIHTAELEYGVTSELKEKDRFRSLTNIPELAKMYAEIADVRNDLNLKLPKPKMRSHIVTVPQTDLMQKINREIVNMVKSKDGSYFNIASNDNTPWGLLASTLSAKAAINPRLIDESWETEGGKIPAVCENVKKIYDQFAEQKGTQLIFCDTGVPGKGKKYDAYSDIINRLVNDYGIPRKEIADIHEANTDEKRKELFAKVNDGSVRILIGGTKNMGTGVNVQKRIVAMHHVDVPWTPADREQREGRGVRQGNEIARDFNDDNVDVYFYATEGSLDMYKYQLQETKGKLFAQFKSGTIGDRTFDEGDAEENFDPAEVVAMLSGNPVIFEKSKQDKKVEKLRRAKRAYESDWQRRHARYEELQTKKSNFERLLSFNAGDVRELERGGFTPDADGKYPTTVTVSVKDDYGSRKTFEKPKEAGAYIHELLKHGKKVQLSGFHQTANISIPVTEAGIFGKPVAELESYGGIKYTVEVSDDDTAAGVAFRNLLQKVYNNRKVYERNIEDVNNQLKGADPGENAFPKQAELDEALKEKKRLDEEYKKLSDGQDKPSANDDTRYRDFDEEVNDQFNRELQRYANGEMDKNEILHLGNPQGVMQMFLPDLPIVMRQRILAKGSVKKHNVAIDSLSDMPLRLSSPIFVFKRSNNVLGVLTEAQDRDGKNVCIAIELNRNIQNGGEVLEVNDIRSVHGRNLADIVYPIVQNGTLRWVDREKGLGYLSSASQYVQQEIDRQDLISAAKIVKDFVNPSIRGEKSSLQGKIDPQDTTPQAKALQAKVLSEKLNTPIRVVSDPEEIAELPSRRQQRAKGWWSAKNDEVVILLPNNADAADVANTAIHEVVGHKGLRKLIGEERFDEFLDEVYDHASKPICASIDQAERKLFDTEVDRLTQQKNAEADRPESRKGVFSRAEATVEANRKREQMRREATEEYMADMAGRIGYEDFEKMSAEELTLWGRIKAKVQRFLDKFLRGLKIAKGVRLTDKDVAYILYKSWKNLRNGGKPTIMDAAEDALMRSKTHYDEIPENDVMFRDGDSVEYRKAQARNLYEQRVSRGLYQMQEAIQDSMLGLKEAMEAVLKAEGGYTGRIEDVAGYENPYLGENRLSSVNQAECAAFAQTLFKPMLEEVARLAKTAKERAELTDYMMAKHGLERNEVMARRAAEKVAHDEFWKELRTAERAAADDPLDQDAADVLADVKQRMLDRGNELYAENRSRDYAGLTALTGKDDVADAESEAEQMVSDYEANHDTTALWDKVNAVTKATLQKTYECGIISKATYDDISDMYEHYIPLRGFDEKTSDEAYAYLSDKHSAFNAPIKTAKGRKSKADDPFANMEAMAESAIMQGNHNMLVKRKFMRFAQNHPSDLVSISDLWLRYDDVADEWKPLNAGDVKGTERIEEDDTPREVERKMRDFEEKMRQLSESDPDHFKKQKDHPDIPYRVVGDRDLRQHQVLVKQGGKDYVLTINGNPRAAQALNGQTNPDNDASGAMGAILHYDEVINRQLSAFYTTRNPDFVVSNFMRDMLYANTMVWAKESPNYALRFHKNFAEVNPAKMKMLFARLRKGTLDVNNETEKAFSLFMANGGETGYSNIRDIEQRKNDIRRELKKYNGKLPVRKALTLLGERFDEYNRAVENCARFAAFMTSRQMKRSIDRSVYDAKEISVNFNKKGSGAKFMNKTGQTPLGNAAALVSGLGRSGFVFWNAAIQGTTNFGRQFKRHPGKALAGAAAMFLLGALVAGIAGDDGNDGSRNSYYNLPEYVRRSNIMFRMPGMEEMWVSIPLPVEYRALYGMGELMISTISGKEHYTSGELAGQIAGQVSQALPIDFMEGGGGFKAFVPSAVKPFAEVMTNKSWTGMPLYKDTPWNKDMPEWTKAYKSANKQLVGLSKVLNEVSGGDAYTSGVIDINPAQVEYLLNGYFGGVSSTIDKFAKMGETALGQREYDPRSFLILNRLVKSGDERTEYRHINNEYFRLKEEHDKLKSRLKHYEEDTNNGVFDYAEKISWLNSSPEYQRLEIFEKYSSDINAINKELKEPMNDNERKELEKELYILKKKLVEEANKTRK